MAADGATGDVLTVDLLSLQGFYLTLQPRIDEVGRALLALQVPPGSDPPALGGFHDAAVTAARHQVLHDQYVRQLGRLLDALTTAQRATARILDAYRTVEELNSVRPDQVQDALGPTGEALTSGRTDA